MPSNASRLKPTRPWIVGVVAPGNSQFFAFVLGIGIYFVLNRIRPGTSGFMLFVCVLGCVGLLHLKAALTYVELDQTPSTITIKNCWRTYSLKSSDISAMGEGDVRERTRYSYINRPCVVVELSGSNAQKIAIHATIGGSADASTWQSIRQWCTTNNIVWREEGEVDTGL